MKKTTTLIILTAILITTLISSAFAHLEGGIDVPTGNKIIDVGYDTENLIAQRPTVFLLSLRNATDIEEQDIETTSAWVKINNEKGQAVFIADILPEPTGAYSFTFTPISGGNYEMTVRFNTKDGQIENEVPLKIGQKSNTIFIIEIMIWIIIILSAVYLKFNGRKRK